MPAKNGSVALQESMRGAPPRVWPGGRAAGRAPASWRRRPRPAAARRPPARPAGADGRAPAAARRPPARPRPRAGQLAAAQARAAARAGHGPGRRPSASWRPGPGIKKPRRFSVGAGKPGGPAGATARAARGYKSSSSTSSAATIRPQRIRSMAGPLKEGHRKPEHAIEPDRRGHHGRVEVRAPGRVELSAPALMPSRGNCRECQAAIVAASVK